jgi:hypothetical protein
MTRGTRSSVRPLGERELADRVLDRDLPGACGGDQEGVVRILDGLPGRRGDALRRERSPEPHMGVKEQLHVSPSPSKA